MKKQLRFLVPVLMMLTLYSCTVNNSTNSSFKRTSSYPCRARQKNVFVFYEKDSVKFKYRQLGTVEAYGRANEPEKDVLDRFKYLAYENCANAIIQVKPERVTKNYGGDYRTEARTYVSNTFRGIAVRIESDSLYKSNALGNSQDLSFVKNTFRNNQAQQKKARLTGALALLTSVAFIGIYLLIVSR